MMGTVTSPPSPTRRRALLVRAPGVQRSALAAALGAAGWTVDEADDPYAATLHFVTAPSDLVVWAVRKVRDTDAAFVRALRSQQADVRLLVLVPPRRRETAARALVMGADAHLPDPCYPEELVAAAGALFRGTAAAESSDEALRLLAAEVAHAVNNPLQILSLIGEADGLPAARPRTCRPASCASSRSHESWATLPAWARHARPPTTWACFCGSPSIRPGCPAWLPTPRHPSRYVSMPISYGPRFAASRCFSKGCARHRTNPFAPAWSRGSRAPAPFSP